MSLLKSSDAYLRMKAREVGAELVEPSAEVTALLPSWGRVARLKTGLHVVWDLRKDHCPGAPEPRGAGDVRIKKGDVVADVGAAYGVFALRCVNAGAVASAYEPTPLLAALLRMTAAQKRALIPCQAAVVGEMSVDGAAELFVSQTGVGFTNGLFRASEKALPIRVRAVHFSIAAMGVTILKIDVEGAEYDYGLPESIPETVHTLLLSFHDVKIPGGWRRRAQRILTMLPRRGFKPVKRVDLDGGMYMMEGVWRRRIA